MKNSNNRVTENIIALTLVKGMDYILAFITFPYLVRVLQVETYGLIVFSQSIVNYFTLFTDYGFNLSGPKAIAQHDDKEEYGIVFANIFGAKLFLLLFWTVVFVIMLCVMTFWGKTDFKLYMIVFLSVIGNVLFPVWFFQGIQQMRYITFVNVIARAFSVVGIFLFVNKPEDYLFAAFCQSMTPLVAAICSWFVIFNNYQEVIRKPTLIGIKKELKDAWPIFASNIAIDRKSVV